jgi:hypothetical protein
MHAPEGIHIVAEGVIDHLRDLQRVLRSNDIASEITSPPKAQCGS